MKKLYYKQFELKTNRHKSPENIKKDWGLLTYSQLTIKIKLFEETIVLQVLLQVGLV